jgi:hypothetical protein
LHINAAVIGGNHVERRVNTKYSNAGSLYVVSYDNGCVNIHGITVVLNNTERVRTCFIVLFLNHMNRRDRP